MTRFYSPFVDIIGQPIRLKEVRYWHLGQLYKNEIEQGTRVQYQKVWDGVFKNEQLCGAICSFANTMGGWLIVGFDGTHILNIDKQRLDFRLTIDELLREHVSPMPVFESRFIASSDPLSGVLIVYVKEGGQPPYVCDGAIYTRNERSATPIHSMRAHLDGVPLENRVHEKQLQLFSRDKIFEDNQKTPICYVSVYNTSKQKYMSGLDGDYIKKRLMMNAGYRRSAMTMNSMVLYREKDMKSCSNAIEIYKDYSAKIYQPLKFVGSGKLSEIRKKMRQADKSINVRQFRVLDGMLSFAALQQTLVQLFGPMRQSGIELDSYIVVFELKNIGNSILYFDCMDNTFFECVREKGLCFAIKNSEEGAPLRLTEYIGEQDRHTAYMLLADGFVSAFGIGDIDFADMYIKAKDMLTHETPAERHKVNGIQEIAPAKVFEPPTVISSVHAVTKGQASLGAVVRVQRTAV